MVCFFPKERENLMVRLAFLKQQALAVFWTSLLFWLWNLSSPKNLSKMVFSLPPSFGVDIHWYKCSIRVFYFFFFQMFSFNLICMAAEDKMKLVFFILFVITCLSLAFTPLLILIRTIQNGWQSPGASHSFINFILFIHSCPRCLIRSNEITNKPRYAFFLFNFLQISPLYHT